MIKPAWLILLVVIPAQALEFEAGIGASYFERTNGLWHQDPFPFSYDRRSQSFNLGVNFDVSEKAKLHLGFKHLGSANSGALATASDLNYHDFLNGGEAWPLSTWIGEGEVNGLYGLISYDFGPLYLKGGAWVHKPEWEMTIPDWRCATQNEQCVPDYPNATYSEPMYLKVENPADLEIGPVLGVGKSFNNFDIEYMIWQVKDGGQFHPIFTGYTQNLNLQFRF